jgi:AraC-like DNA-binding protein
VNPLFAVSERSYTDEPRTERHPFLQLVVPVRGRLDMVIAGQEGYAGDAHFAQVPVGVEHRYWANRPNRLLILDLSPELVTDERQRSSAHLAAPFRAIDKRMTIFSALLQAELASGGLQEPLVSESLGRYACTLLTTTVRSEGAGSSPGERGLALRTRDYLDTFYLEPLSIAGIANAVGASASHMQRTFRAHLGVAIVPYVQARRLEHARALLHTSDLSIAEIAFASGFSSQSYFTRLFTREMGFPPSHFRATNCARSDKYVPDSCKESR